jgi:Tfp pilus assembly protein PilW
MYQRLFEDMRSTSINELLVAVFISLFLIIKLLREKYLNRVFASYNYD